MLEDTNQRQFLTSRKDIFIPPIPSSWNGWDCRKLDTGAECQSDVIVRLDRAASACPWPAGWPLHNARGHWGKSKALRSRCCSGSTPKILVDGVCTTNNRVERAGESRGSFLKSRRRGWSSASGWEKRRDCCGLNELHYDDRMNGEIVRIKNDWVRNWDWNRRSLKACARQENWRIEAFLYLQQALGNPYELISRESGILE